MSKKFITIVFLISLISTSNYSFAETIYICEFEDGGYNSYPTFKGKYVLTVGDYQRALISLESDNRTGAFTDKSTLHLRSHRTGELKKIGEDSSSMTFAVNTYEKGFGLYAIVFDISNREMYSLWLDLGRELTSGRYPISITAPHWTYSDSRGKCSVN